MITLVLLILVIVLFIDNEKLRKEVMELKIRLSSALASNNKGTKRNFCPKCGKKLENKDKCLECGYTFGDKLTPEIKPEQKVEPSLKRNFCPRCGKKLQNEYKCDSCGFEFGMKLKPKKEISPEEKKNNAILITGSALIILSAIIFLTTTWNTSANYLKTLVLVFMFGVFFATSRIADSVFHLKKTSKAFLNIALSYIPIMLFSITLFGLFGDYLSISGEGKNIYLSFSALVTSIIYYKYSSNWNNKFLTCGTYMFQGLFTLFFINIFTDNISDLISGMFIYDLFIISFLPKIIKTNNKINEKVGFILYVSLNLVLINFVLGSIFVKTIDTHLVFLLLTYLFTSKAYLDLLNKSKSLYKLIYPITVLTIIYSINFMICEDTFFIRNMLMIGLLGLNIYEIIKNKSISLAMFIINALVTLMLLIITWVCSFNDSYVVLLLLTVLDYLCYKNCDKKLNNLTLCSIPVLIILTFLLAIISNDLSFILMTIVCLIMFILSYVFDKDKKESKVVALISTICTVWTLAINLFIHCNDSSLLPLSLIISIVYFISGLNKNNDCYKVIGYILFNVFALKLFENADYIYYPLVTTIVTLIITIINNNYEKTKVDNYLIIQYVFSFFMISVFELSIYSLIGLFLLIISSHLIVKDNQLNNVTLFTLIPVLYLKSSFLNEYLCFLSAITILSLALVAYEKKNINIYTVASLVYFAFHYINLNSNVYLNYMLIIFISFVHIFSNEGNNKDIFKFGFYLFTFMLVNNLICDYIGTFDYLLSSIFAVVFVLLSTRTIFNKYFDWYKIIEYIAFAMISLNAIGLVGTEIEGYMLLTTFVVFVIIGYLYRLGPLLAVSLISVLYCTFVLTKEFWLSISWWIYILAIGIILVVFAINNEARGKKENDTKEKLKQIKEKYDL